jgi:tetratricopeptide (TPR) repeat protein
MLHAANNLGWVSSRAADHVQAITSYRYALQVARDMGDRHTADVIVVGNLSEIYRKLGDLRRARVCATHSLLMALDLGDRASAADQVAELGAIAAAEGHWADAQPLLERAIELARDMGTTYYLCDWLHRLARVHMDADRPAEAERLNSEALRIAEEHDERDARVNAYVMSIRLQVAAGEIEAHNAAELLRKAADEWTEAHEVAALLDAAWYADPADEDARTTAAEIYRRLYARAPSVEYRLAYQRLTGELLPPGPPLPELPEWITAASVPGLGTLLDRIDRALRPQPV